MFVHRGHGHSDQSLLEVIAEPAFALSQGLFGPPSVLDFPLQLLVRLGEFGGAIFDSPFKFVMGLLQRLFGPFAFTMSLPDQ